ncbi:MAG: response regulator transcription factor [bacterium]|nr:response regulator transcription factor [bacterium]
MKVPQKVFLVDDHPLFREGLRSRLSRDARFQIVGEAHTAEEANRRILETKPDIITLDISLPGKDGLEFAQELRFLNKEIKILVITFLKKVDTIQLVFQAGANGYLCKESAAEWLIIALEDVANNQHFLDRTLPPEFVRRLMSGLKPPEKEPPIDQAYNALPKRAKEIFFLVADGKSTAEIMEALSISDKTVRNYKTAIFDKLHIKSAVDANRYAIKIGLIDS